MFAPSTQGQGASPSPAAAAPDDAIPVPIPTGVLGKKDAAALAEITSHLTAVGATPWLGMQGTGKITFGPDLTSSYDATLTNLGTDRFRLDAQTNKGLMSIRIMRNSGKSRGGDDTTSVIPGDTALVGVFPFELIRNTYLVSNRTSVIDHGAVVLEGSEVHRITLEGAAIGRNPVTKAQRTFAIDFYFDPTTHLLTKSAASTAPAPGQQARLLDVVTYADYRRVGGTLVPFRFTETIEGQQSMSLQLSDVQLNPTLDATYFEF